MPNPYAGLVMLRLRPSRLLVDGWRLARSLQPQARCYATKKPPNPEGLNYPLLSKLYDEYIEYSEGEERNVHKIKAFKTAISALDNLPFQVQRIQDVEKIKGIGAGMKRRIEEVLVDEEEHGIIPSTSNNIDEKKELLQAVKLFQTISGVGPQKAKKLAESGFRTLEDIMADEDTFAKLPHAIQTSMKHNSKTLERIQRDDVDRLSTLISDTLGEFDVYITGSYRRGAPSSSDIDVLVFHKDYQTTPPQGQRATTKKAQEKARSESPLLSKAIPLLIEAKVLKEPLTSGPTKWQGLALLEPDGEKLCRIDLNLMPTASRGAALVGYTGDAEFNRYLRGKAIKVGMRLNDFGLWKRPADWEPSQDIESKEDDENWELVPTETEQDVFEELNEGWVDPEKRNFNNLQGRKRRKSDS